MTATQRALLNTASTGARWRRDRCSRQAPFCSLGHATWRADRVLVDAGPGDMWNLLAGYADIVTVGQHAFVGVGAYAFYAFAALAGVDPYLSMPLAGVVALIVAVPAMALVVPSAHRLSRRLEPGS